MSTGRSIGGSIGGSVRGSVRGESGRRCMVHRTRLLSQCAFPWPAPSLI